MTTITAIRASNLTDPGIPMFDVYMDGKFMRQVQAYTPTEAKKVFAAKRTANDTVAKAVDKVANETSEQKLRRQLFDAYYSPLRQLMNEV